MAVTPFRCLTPAARDARIVQRHLFKYTQARAGSPIMVPLHSQILDAWEDESSLINVLVESNPNPETQVQVGVMLVGSGEAPPENSVFLTAVSIRTKRTGVNMKYVYIA